MRINRRPLRALLLSRPARKTLIAVARAESRHLAVRLRATGTPVPPRLGWSPLARVLFERDLLRFETSILFALLMITLLMLGVTLLTLPLWLGSDDAAGDVAVLSLFVTYGVMLAVSALNLWLDRRSLDGRRRQRYQPRSRRLVETWAINLSILVMLAMASGSLFLAFKLVGETTPEQLFDAGVTSAGAAVWAAMLLMPGTWMGDRRLAAWRTPDGEIVRHLANAFTLIADSRPAEWRNIKHRHAAAVQLAAAANVLEGRYRSSLARFVIDPGAPAWEVAGERVARLRGLAAQLALSDADQQPRLAPLVGRALGALLTGQAGELPADGLAFSRGGGALRRKSGGTRRWVATALAPALLLIVLVAVGKTQQIAWIVQNENTFIQLALIALLVGTTAAVDPRGYDKRVGAITGAGGALFGWGKAKG